MKVLLTNFHRGWGGQPAMVRMLARELRDAGVEVRVACPPGSRLAAACLEEAIPTWEGARFEKSSHLLSTWRDTLALARHLRGERYDLVHSNGSQDTWSLVFARLLFRIRVPHVATRHNTKPVRPHVFNRLLWGRWVTRLVCVSGGTKRVFEPFFRAGSLDPDRVAVIHPAFEAERFRNAPSREEARKTIGIPPEIPVAGVMGRLDPDKGHEHLLRAWPEVLHSLPRARLLLAGEGRHEPALRDLVRELRIGESVAFLGFREDVPVVTAALDVSVLPSVGTDSSSTVVKEAGACAVPVVATEIGGIREIVEDGVTGIVVPPADPAVLATAIVTLLSDPARASAMGRAARKRILSLFTAEKMRDAYLAVYRDVVAGGG